MPTSTLTSKGQITVPKEVRERLHLRTGSRLDFIMESSGQVILKPLDADFRSIRGIVCSKRKRPVSVKEMNEAIARGYSGE
jgi:AbrB family looped-hinge helix DNA binding protein